LEEIIRRDPLLAGLLEDSLITPTMYQILTTNLFRMKKQCF